MGSTPELLQHRGSLPALAGHAALLCLGVQALAVLARRVLLPASPSQPLEAVWKR